MEKVDQIIEGLNIFKKYGEVSIQAEHDELFAGPVSQEVSTDDRKRLEEIGWRDGDTGWSIFT